MKEFLKENGIDFYALIPLKSCKIIKEYLLTKNGFDETANVITMLFPYRSEKIPKNLSIYASVRDYHEYICEFSKKIEAYIQERHPGALFKVFSDHSPIDEVHACCISGLGFIGDNGLLINEKYSSFVFLGECITNLSKEALGLEYSLFDGVKECLHCGKCAQACPCGCIKKAGEVSCNSKNECLSAITQKKGELCPDEQKLMIENNTFWGCDICQNVCPYTKNALYTSIDYFKKDVICELDERTLSSLSNEEFKKRPFAWRGRGVIERNVKLYEKNKIKIKKG